MPRGPGKDMHFRWNGKEFRTVAELCGTLQCSAATVNRILAGKTTKPSSLHLRKHKIERVARKGPAAKRTLVEDAQAEPQQDTPAQIFLRCPHLVSLVEGYLTHAYGVHPTAVILREHMAGPFVTSVTDGLRCVPLCDRPYHEDYDWWMGDEDGGHAGHYLSPMDMDGYCQCEHACAPNRLHCHACTMRRRFHQRFS